MPLDPITAVAPVKPARFGFQLTPHVKRVGIFTLVLLVAFAKPLYDLTRFSVGSELYSHILLIPFVSLYLVWLKRRQIEVHPPYDRRLAALFAGIGLALVSGYWIGWRFGWQPAPMDYLALMTFAFVCFFVAGCIFICGRDPLRPIVFPLAFLVFMVPMPVFLLHWVESFLQHGSADATYWLFKLSGMPVLRVGTYFQLPGFSMEVAPQCSGIHSSLVLFISSLLAGYLLLRTGWSKGVFALAVIPLALLRNGIRIFTLGQLCVHVNPDFINSDLHRRGGPLFFAMSLVPFFLLLFLLRKWENKRNPKAARRPGHEEQN